MIHTGPGLTLRERWVGVTCPGDVLGRGLVLHGQNSRSDHFTGVGALNESAHRRGLIRLA